MSNDRRSFVIMAGGTGGHVYPGLAVAEHLREHDIDVHWMGTKSGLEARVVPAAGIPMHWITVQGLRGKGVLGLLLAPFRILRAVLQAKRELKQIKPAAVLGMGGFASGPGGLAAWLLGIPVLIHEQNCIAGLTNRSLAKIAKTVLQGFPNTFSQGVTVGNPVRDVIAELPEPKERFIGRFDQPRLLVVGGSLGAAAINEIMPEILSKIPKDKRPLVRHQAGPKLIDKALAAYKEFDVDAEVMPYIEDMAEAYGWADLVVCRSGALTIAELTAAGLAAILIPYPYAVDDHQTSNGQFLVERKAAYLIQQDELDVDRMADYLSEIMFDRSRLLDMAERARTSAFPNATQEVIEWCMKELKHE